MKLSLDIFLALKIIDSFLVIEYSDRHRNGAAFLVD